MASRRVDFQSAGGGSRPGLPPIRAGIASLLLVVAVFAIHLRASAPSQQPAQPPLSAQVLAQIAALTEDKRTRTPVQQKIDSHLLRAAQAAAGRGVAGVPPLVARLPLMPDGRVLLDVRATVTEPLVRSLGALGAEVTSRNARYRHLGVRARLETLEAIAALPGVDSIVPESGFITSASRGPGQGAIVNTGTVMTQGDVSHRANEARANFGVTGSGVKIGVLSDGVGNLAESQATGNLGPVTVLAPGTGNEGTAMLEIIADLAPGAELYFASANGGPASFAQRIHDLRAAGCDIIVDDVFYFVESAFQDGQIGTSPTNGGIIIQAVKDVAASGALYFSAAGNSGRFNAGTSGTWEGDFTDGGPASLTQTGRSGRIHDFGSGQLSNRIEASGAVFNTLYWADPLGASANDYDLYLVDAAGTTILDAGTNSQTGTQDPYEFVDAGVAGARLVVVKVAGASRFLHLSTNRGRLAIATAGQIHGHAATSAPNTFGVAAALACTAAGFGGTCTSPFNSGTAVETFSSDGPRRIFYTSDGAPITAGNFSSTGGRVLAKPDITAADGVATSVPSFTMFSGTSAAAPHAAAIAALVKSRTAGLTAARVSETLLSTAIDIHSPGWDRDSGGGIVMAFESVQGGVPPAAPAGLIVTRTGPDSANVSWNGVSGATSYTVKVGAAPTAVTPIVTVAELSASLQGLARGSTYYIVVSASNSFGESADSPAAAFVIPRVDVAHDFDRDARADLVVWRPALGTWFWLSSSTGNDPVAAGGKQWGVATDRPLGGDIDGDGAADLIIWRPETGTWFWLTSSTGYSYANQGSKQWGVSTDIPLTGDIDGDGRTDLIVWRPSTGTWFWLTSANGYDYASQGSTDWGNSDFGDVPLLGDFDGDGKADLTVWRASDGTWFWLSSSAAYSYASQSSKRWGDSTLGDRPHLGDIDGDGRSDLTIWRASTGTWFWLTSSSGFDYATQGSAIWGSHTDGDVPMLGELDGDGRAELIVWRPDSGVWFWLNSSSAYTSQAQVAWGASGDIPMIR